MLYYTAVNVIVLWNRHWSFRNKLNTILNLLFKSRHFGVIWRLLQNWESTLLHEVSFPWKRAGSRRRNLSKLVDRKYDPVSRFIHLSLLLTLHGEESTHSQFWGRRQMMPTKSQLLNKRFEMVFNLFLDVYSTTE